METHKENRITYYIGLILIAAGLLGGRFMVIRPNRIVDGTVLDASAAMEGRLFLLAAVFLLAAAAIFLYIRFGRLTPSVLLLLMLGVFGIFLALTGSAAARQLTGLPSAARVSLGIGFWSVLAGLALLIARCAKDSGIHKERMQLFAMGVCVFILIFFYRMGWIEDISIIRELSARSDRIFGELLRHLQLTLSAAMTGLVLSLLMSYWAYRNPGMERIVSTFANFAQVVPTLSLLGLVMIPLALLAKWHPFLREIGISGIGFFPSYIVLTVYTLLPITSNAIAGLASINPSIIEAGEGMGMSRWQMLRKIELPMALPAIYTGFRTALVQTVGNTILAGLVGGGGLGAILFLGLAQSAPDLVVVSSLMVVGLAVILNVGMTSLDTILKKRFRGEIAHD